jgi:tetraacyldisaccharide 4'-kinase
VVPSGRLREFACGSRRADLIMITKTPKILSPITRRRILEQLKPLDRQKVFFSYIKYGDPLPVFDTPALCFPAKPAYILLFTGIAHDYPLKEHLERLCRDLVVVRYPDHHPYSPKDAEYLKNRFEDLPGQKKVLVTTEKDAMRLRMPDTGNIFRNIPLFYIPMEIDIHGPDKEVFNKVILDYVEQNKRDHRVPGNEDQPQA